jgi:hypothetical protein
MNKLILLCSIIFVISGSCAKSTNNELEVYNNDFESGSLVNITNGIISPFNGSKVLGNYNNGQFELSVKDLPTHDLVDISFDLYIHDSWEGSQNLRDNVSGPDLWLMKVDDKTYIYATFANFDCIPGNFCPGQSYPANYPTQSYNPKTAAFSTDLPGFCSEINTKNGTTLYKIHKSINHSGATLSLQCLDKLIQKDVTDAKCDESWSVDNIKIKVININ